MRSPDGDLHYMPPAEVEEHTLDRSCRCGPAFMCPCPSCARDGHGSRLLPKLACERCGGTGMVDCNGHAPHLVVIHARVNGNGHATA